MTDSKKNEDITFDLSSIGNLGNLLTPISIFISAAMISVSIFTSTRSITLKMPEEVSPMEALAQEIGADLGKFQQCVEKNNTQEIKDDMAEFDVLVAELRQIDPNVGGTPSFIIGKLENGTVTGTFISGAYPYDVFKPLIDSYLAGDEPQTEFLDAAITVDDDPYLGDLGNAKVAIVEFSDYECPFCQRFHQQTFPSIKSDYIDNGEIAFVYRDYPLSFHDPMATEAAVAANCVFELEGREKYFEFSQQYYERTQSNKLGLPAN